MDVPITFKSNFIPGIKSFDKELESDNHLLNDVIDHPSPFVNN